MTIAMSGYMYRGTKFLSPSPFLSFIQRLILSTNIPPKTNIHSQIPPSTVHLSFLNLSPSHYSSHVSRYLSLLLLSLAPIYISQAFTSPLHKPLDSEKPPHSNFKPQSTSGRQPNNISLIHSRRGTAFEGKFNFLLLLTPKMLFSFCNCLTFFQVFPCCEVL